MAYCNLCTSSEKTTETTTGSVDMSAISTLLNPLAVKEHELLTFWVDRVGHLSLTQTRQPLQHQKLSNTNINKQIGTLTKSSSVVALEYNGLISVYGCNGGVVQRLSPTVESLQFDITVPKGSPLAGVTNSAKNTAWLYYFTATDDDNDDDQNDEFSIVEYNVNRGRGTVVTHQTSRPGSKLAAAIFPDAAGAGSRRVFFQPKRTNFIHFSAPEHENDQRLAGTDISRKGTPLAACTVTKGRSGETWIYLYFVDGQHDLHRSRIGKNGRTDTTRVSRAPKLASWSPLAVTTWENHNLLTFINGEGLLTHHADQHSVTGMNGTTDGGSAEKWSYLYFVDPDDTLHRARVGDISRVDRTPSMARWSQLAASAGEKHGLISFVADRKCDRKCESCEDILELPCR
ncbi:hypothetical protein K461DRAFT_319061 [Myriangium duriaei CBS 260.36]|uniref:Fucose-specific lectin n=1 Tax=Myriangium duriaei CBS 260.36 TaxID=1168546 RepID=A0A9P4J2Z3_9PEZI|nr:hypothetical protein K461DRAFT_319061 [Myriangium duriaei CBS 260.36]